MTPDVLIQSQGFHAGPVADLLEALLEGSLDGFPQGAPPHLEVPGQGGDDNISGEELVNGPRDGSGREVLARRSQLRGLPPGDLGAGVLSAPPGAPGPHEEDGDPEDSGVVEETPLATIRHGLDPADRAEHLPGIGLDVDTHARR